MDAIVSPANSFGFMDGGIDMVGTLIFRNLAPLSQNVGKCPGGGGVQNKFSEAPLQGSFRISSTYKW